MQSVSSAHEESAINALHDILAKVGDSRTEALTQCRRFDIINTLIRLSSRLGKEIPLSDISECASITELDKFRQKTEALTRLLCEQYSRLRQDKQDSLKTHIINYVEANYCNNQFGLQMVADEFGISINYLSRFFKKETNLNFVDYVSMLRLDKAKELLTTTTKPVQEIVARVGYTNTASFLRKFKAQEGLTPIQFRTAKTAYQTKNSIAEKA
jgi:YesN/AraC family two-component response regulator